MAEYKGASSEGGRAAYHVKKREAAKEQLEKEKDRIVQENKQRLGIINNKFATHNIDAVEQQLKSTTVGLVTLDEMKARHESLVEQHSKKLAGAVGEKEAQRKREKKRKEANDKKRMAKQVLSFGGDEDEEDDEGSKSSDDDSPPPAKKKKKFGKDPSVDTSFLPDQEREEAERKEREQLQAEWRAQQEKLKNEDISITYSYWDGTGHRKVAKMKKGNSVHDFLNTCMKDLRNQFTELRGVSTENLMYIKEDLIIPQHYTFYDFIVTKARGKSGPLFSFDVHDDVRMVNDANAEKHESHAGKVVCRSWYERNKHIFPCSRWEPYDPNKKWEIYTISDGPKPK